MQLKNMQEIITSLEVEKRKSKRRSSLKDEMLLGGEGAEKIEDMPNNLFNSHFGSLPTQAIKCEEEDFLVKEEEKI